MSKIDVHFGIWILAQYLSPILFFTLSKLSVTQIKKKTIVDNYFTYYIVFLSFHILWARFFFRNGAKEFWILDDFLFRGLPLTIVILFFLKKAALIWVYFAFSVGTIVFYILNIFEPGMSLSLNLKVILPHIFVLALYFWYLKKNFRSEFSKNFDSLKFWLFDGSFKKNAMQFYAPVVALFATYGLVVLTILFKFRHVILNRISLD